jgi:hypothetical protein
MEFMSIAGNRLMVNIPFENAVFAGQWKEWFG